MNDDWRLLAPIGRTNDAFDEKGCIVARRSDFEPKCERCGATKIVGMWSPDGLPGHEILVCRQCWNELEDT